MGTVQMFFFIQFHSLVLHRTEKMYSLFIWYHCSSTVNSTDVHISFLFHIEILHLFFEKQTREREDSWNDVVQTVFHLFVGSFKKTNCGRVVFHTCLHYEAHKLTNFRSFERGEGSIRLWHNWIFLFVS